MSYPLHDFRIENENLILLWFANGTSARVRPDDLANYLSKPDLDKVDKAMHQRRKFIKKVLPPTALFILSGCMVSFAALDSEQLMHRLQPAQPPAQEQLLTPMVEPAPANPPWGADYDFTPHVPSPATQFSPSSPSATSPLPAPAAEAHAKNQVQSQAADHSRSQSATKAK